MSDFTKRFYKDLDNCWYIDLPEYIESGFGDKSNLEMVAGADTLLDILSNNGDNVTVHFSSEPFDDYQYLLETDSEEPDGWYEVKNLNLKLWLCPVTLYVFNGIYPPNIYINKIK